MPSSLNCPTCGAAAAGPDATRCAYCGSTLTSVACPSCFGTMFAGMDFCPHCGAKGARTVDATKTLPCPSCKGQLQSVQVGSTGLFECAGCAGMWLDPATFAQLCANREERGAVAAMVGGAGSGSTDRPASVGGAVHYLPCPQCKKFMNRQNFGHVSGQIVSVCKGDGVWFERGELQLIMAFIDGGGLERAKAHDAQVRNAELQMERLNEAGLPNAGQSPAISFQLEAHQSGDSVLDGVLRKLFT